MEEARGIAELGRAAANWAINQSGLAPESANQRQMHEDMEQLNTFAKVGYVFCAFIALLAIASNNLPLLFTACCFAYICYELDTLSKNIIRALDPLSRATYLVGGINAPDFYRNVTNDTPIMRCLLV